MKLTALVFSSLFLFSCKSDALFQSRKYQGGGNTLEFYPDHTYQYLQRMEGGYVYELSRGTWEQSDNKLFLHNGVKSLDELPINVSTNSSDDQDIQVIVNILPKKTPMFAHLPGAIDLLNIELVIDKAVYPLKSETSIFRFQRPFDKGYVRVYAKADVEKNSEVLNDTLRSKDITIKDFKNQTVVVDVDCNPNYLAQIKLPDDTLRIINDRKIKWNKIYLERPQ